jgi:nitroreductase
MKFRSQAKINTKKLQSFVDLASSRRSVRSFDPGQQVPKDTLEKIADAGRWAPSGANSQPWEICVVEDPERVREVASVMASQADRLNEHCKGFPHVHKKHWVHDSIALIAVFVDPRWAATYPVALDPELDRAEYETNRSNILLVSVGAAIQNLQLATTAAGLTSAWLSGGGEPQTASDLQALLGFPSTHIPYGIVPVVEKLRAGGGVRSMRQFIGTGQWKRIYEVSLISITTSRKNDDIRSTKMRQLAINI